MADRLDTAGPHFAAMADRFLPQSAPSTGHGGQVGVLPRICYVFVGGSRFARAVKHIGLDTSAPRFTAMAERLLPQSTPSVGHGGKVAVLPRIWHVFIVCPPFTRTVKHGIFAVWGVESWIVLRFPAEKAHQASPGKPWPGQLS